MFDGELVGPAGARLYKEKYFLPLAGWLSLSRQDHREHSVQLYLSAGPTQKKTTSSLQNKGKITLCREKKEIIEKFQQTCFSMSSLIGIQKSEFRFQDLNLVCSCFQLSVNLLVQT